MDPLGGLGLGPPVRDHALSGGKILVAIFFSIIPYVTLSNVVVSILFSVIPYITLSGRVFTFCGVKRASLVVAKNSGWLVYADSVSSPAYVLYGYTWTCVITGNCCSKISGLSSFFYHFAARGQSIFFSGSEDRSVLFRRRWLTARLQLSGYAPAKLTARSSLVQSKIPLTFHVVVGYDLCP